MFLYYKRIVVLGHGNSIGVVKQKFPENDWDDVPFSPSLNIVGSLIFIFKVDYYSFVCRKAGKSPMNRNNQLTSSGR